MQMRVSQKNAVATSEIQVHPDLWRRKSLLGSSLQRQNWCYSGPPRGWEEEIYKSLLTAPEKALQFLLSYIMFQYQNSCHSSVNFYLCPRGERYNTTQHQESIWVSVIVHHFLCLVLNMLVYVLYFCTHKCPALPFQPLPKFQNVKYILRETILWEIYAQVNSTKLSWAFVQ